MTKSTSFHGSMWALAMALLLGTPTGLLSAQDAAIQAPPATSGAPIDFDTAEFENFGDEDFVVEDELSPEADAAVIAIRVVVGGLLLLIVLWLIVRVARGRRTRSGPDTNTP